MTVGTSPTVADETSRPKMALVCTDTARDDDFCQAVGDALRDARPEYELRRVQRATDDTLDGTDTVILHLQVSTYTDTAIAARLVRAGPEDKDYDQGPELGFNVMDTSLSHQMLAGFARDLVKASTSLFTP